MENIKKLEKICTQVRRDIVRMVHNVQSGHPGGSLGCTEYFVALYYKILNHNPKKFTINGINEDIFILSNGHISPVFYSTLARSGYFKIKELNTFRKINSRYREIQNKRTIEDKKIIFSLLYNKNKSIEKKIKIEQIRNEVGR